MDDVLEKEANEVELYAVSSCCGFNVYAPNDKVARCLTCFEECEVVFVE